MAAKAEELYTAARSGRLPEVERLLNEGASPDAEKHGTALVAAAYNGHLDVVKVLVRAGAKLEATNSSDGVTALMWAAGEGKDDCVEFLLGAGADVHAANELGDTALHRAARWGQLQCARLLVGAGADAAKRNMAGQTALAAAQEAGKYKVAALLSRWRSCGSRAGRRRA